MGKDSTRLKWQRLISEQKKGQLTVAEFCRRKGVSDVSFYQWRKKISRSAPVVQKFVPLSVATGTNVEVELPCGAVIRIPSGDHGMLENVIAALRNAGEAGS